MNRYSKVQSSIWQSKKFREAKAYRLEYMYLITCSQCNSAGFFEFNKGYALEDLMCTPQRLNAALEFLQKVKLIETNGDIIFIKQYLRWNPIMNPNHAKGTLSEIQDFLDIPLYSEFYKDLQMFCKKGDKDFTKGFPQPKIQYQNSSETVSKQLPNGISTETETNTKTITETERETITPPAENLSLLLGEFHHVLMSKEEYEKLCLKYGAYLVDDKISYLDAQIQSKVKKYMAYKDHYATIGNWCRSDMKKKDVPPEQKPKDWELLPWPVNLIKQSPYHAKNCMDGPMRSKLKAFYAQHGIDIERAKEGD